MNVLLVGSGGREHALAWKLAQSPRLDRLFIAPGNPGMARLGTLVAVSRAEQLVDIAQREQVGLVVIGPEAYLDEGLADLCIAAGIPVFGPTRAAARIESSKAFAKQLMLENDVPTAAAYVFEDAASAEAFVRREGCAWVVKADGLAAGKGVVVAETVDETLDAVHRLAATAAGRRLVLEERLVGPEVSLIALCDGKRLLPLPPAQDHKRLLNGDAGPNTGGMGAYAPAQVLGENQVNRVVQTCLQPIVQALAALGTPFCGALYAGLIMTADGPKVLEFNARFGDPETQVLMPLIEGDLLSAMLQCAEGNLPFNAFHWRHMAAACVVLAAEGYPGTPRRGDRIDGLEALDDPDVLVFHAGTDWQDGVYVTNGGRVLGVTGTGHTLNTAIRHAYNAIEAIGFPGMQYRTDIGAKGL
jgi:phosphoribosylamine--glycine ligase